jgi:hypothetical protein
VKGAVIERNIFYSCDAQQNPSSDGSPRKGHPATKLSDTQADYNLYFNEEDPQWGARHLAKEQPNGIERHSVSADPLFAGIDRADFTFLAGSPALELGIRQPIAVKETGPQGKYRP